MMLTPKPSPPPLPAKHQDADAMELKAELAEIRKSIRNAMGAIESNQVVDKDVHGTLKGVLKRIDALSHPRPVVVKGLDDAAWGKILKKISWIKVEPSSRRFTDTWGQNEVIGFQRAEEIVSIVRSALIGGDAQEGV